MVLAYIVLLVVAELVYCQKTVPLCRDIPLSALRDPSPFTCSSPDRHSWSGSAFTNQCPSAMPIADQILLNDTLQMGTCGVFTGTVTTVTGDDVVSTLHFTPTQDMNGLSIQCLDASGAVLECSNFTIEIIMAENLTIDSVVDSNTTYGCVTATLESPENTTGISSYIVGAILPVNGTVPPPNTSDNAVPPPSTNDNASDLEVEICGLNLCDENYMYIAEANGGIICPSITSATLSLSTLGRIDSLRRRDGDTIEWDRPSNAPLDCTIVGYTISVYRLSSGPNITHGTTSNMVSLSNINEDLDTCDRNLRITVAAEVATIGLVMASETNPAFNPTSAFPSNPSVAINGRPTYAVSTNDMTVVQLAVTPVGEDVLKLFPDIYRTVNYTGSSPLCRGTLVVKNNVIELNSTCLGDMNFGFAVTFMDEPDCISSTISITSLSFPLIAEPDFQPNITVTSESAEISVPLSTAVNVQANRFNVVGTATQAGDSATATSDAATYPANAIFNDLDSNTGYSFVIQIVSRATDHKIIGSFSGTFTTRSSSFTESDNIAPIVGGVAGGVGGVLLVIGVLVVVYFCYQNKNKGSSGKPPEKRELRERIGSADGPPDVEKAEMEMRSHTYADPSGVEQYVENVEMEMKSPIYSDLSPPDVENVNMEMTSPICSDISAIERQEFPGTHDVYTVVDKTKKTPKPEDHLPSYQAPDKIKRQGAPDTGEMYTIPEIKGDKTKSFKKKETTPPPKSEEELQQIYSQADTGKNNQPPNEQTYSDLILPPSGKTPPSNSVDCSDIQPH